MILGQVIGSGVDCVGSAADHVASQVEIYIGRVLCIEDSGSGAHRPLRAWAPECARGSAECETQGLFADKM
jgi:hypothetical protein